MELEPELTKVSLTSESMLLNTKYNSLILREPYYLAGDEGK